MSAADHLSQAQLNHVRKLHGTADHVIDREGYIKVGPPGFEKPSEHRLRLEGSAGKPMLRVGGLYMVHEHGEQTPIQ